VREEGRSTGQEDGMEPGDRKMFALMFRGEARSPEGQVCAVLGGMRSRRNAGATGR